MTLFLELQKLSWMEDVAVTQTRSSALADALYLASLTTRSPQSALYTIVWTTCLILVSCLCHWIIAGSKDDKSVKPQR